MLNRISAAAAAAVCAATLAAVPVASAQTTLDPGKVPPRTQITLRYSNGAQVATANANESRPALSLSKLYLGYWVLKYGAPEDKAQVYEMIRVSHDGIASNLDRKYPQAIPGIIREYNLTQTHYNGYWGNTTTSTNDVARFTSTIYGDPIAAPLFAGMNNAAPVAADGYRQDYGTSRIAGIRGTKFGWSDDRSINASVSTGNGFVIAANTYGPAAQLTADVMNAVNVAAPLPIPAPAPAPGAPQIERTSADPFLQHLPAQVRGQARQAAIDAQRAVDNARNQACAQLASAGSSQVC